ncbi:MAG: hypothetical protein PHZ00_00625 [Candidatus Peribacteraceae bacterium]|nr:hypothetical protein [Candidatus Peribacteraceae bacterium]
MGLELRLADKVNLLIGIGFDDKEGVIEALPFLDAALAKLEANTRQYLVALHCCNLTPAEIESLGGWTFGEGMIMKCDGKNKLSEKIYSAIREASAIEGEET